MSWLAGALRGCRVDRRVGHMLVAGARGRRIVAGPWTGESGYEALYWIPFLRWAIGRYAVAPERVTAVAHRRMAPCYAGVTKHVVEPGELDPPALEHAALWGPGLMEELFAGFWSGNRPLDFFFRHTDFRYPPVRACDVRGGLEPGEYAAMELYTGAAVSDTERNRELLRHIADRLAARLPVVTIDSRTDADPVRVIAGARQFVGVCGGLAWLAPFLGVETVAIHDGDGRMSTHLYAARYAYRKSRAAPFSVLDLGALASAPSSWTV